MRPVYSLARWLPLLLLLTASTAGADQTTERAELLRRLRAATSAVSGIVVDVQARLERNDHGDTLIVSQVSVDVAEHLIGRGPSRVVFDVEGGSLNGFTLRVSDLPELRRGHRAVFLLRPDRSHKLVLSDRGASVLPLTPANAIAGSVLTMQDVRQLARQVPQ